MVLHRVAHSPDTDDLFMFWAIATGVVDTGNRSYELTAGEVEVLNREARKGTYDVTAISFGAYPEIADRYAILGSGASIGEGYGPVVCAANPCDLASLDGARVAVPGLLTTARLVFRLAVPAGADVSLPFDEIQDAVRSGQVDAGVLIHEGQLTWAADGLHHVADLGAWWKEQEGLPLPLGANAIRRDLPDRDEVAGDIRRSIEAGLEHRAEALAWTNARIEEQGGRGMTLEQSERYLDMYVSAETVCMSDTTRRAVRRLIERGVAAGLCSDVDVSIIG